MVFFFKYSLIVLNCKTSSRNPYLICFRYITNRFLKFSASAIHASSLVTISFFNLFMLLFSHIISSFLIPYKTFFLLCFQYSGLLYTENLRYFFYYENFLLFMSRRFCSLSLSISKHPLLLLLAIYLFDTVIFIYFDWYSHSSTLVTNFKLSKITNVAFILYADCSLAYVLFLYWLRSTTYLFH